MATAVPDNWIYLQPGWFDGFRKGFFPTQYASNQTPVEADILEAGLIFSGIILGFSLLIILPGIRSSDRLSAFLRIIVGVFVLTTIMLSNFGQEWEVAHIKTKTQYRAGLSEEINATIGVLIGLRSVNITLRAVSPDHTVQFNHGLVKETIDYNERISWDNAGWTVGRGGFGPYAGKYNQEFREHQRKGSPYPILWVAEYFTLDGEGVRWGRHYLQAGYFTHIVLWTALPLWWLSMILFKMVIRYGAYFSILTGICMFAGNVIYATLRNPFALVIPFEDEHLHFTWGWSFWLCLVTGLVTTIIGIVIIILDYCVPEKLSDFFGVDITQDLEEFYAEPEDEINVQADEIEGISRIGMRRKNPTIILKNAAPRQPDMASPNAVVLNENGGEMEMQPPAPPGRHYQRQPSNDVQRGYRRRTLFPAAKKSLKQKPRPLPPPRPHQGMQEDEGQEVYINAGPGQHNQAATYDDA